MRSLMVCKLAASLKKMRLKVTVTNAFAAAKLAEMDMGRLYLLTAKDISNVPVAQLTPTKSAIIDALGGKLKLSLNRNDATVPVINTPILMSIIVFPAESPRTPACFKSVKAIPIKRAGSRPPTIIPFTLSPF